MKKVTASRFSGGRVLACKLCGRKVHNVDAAAAHVKCWRCVCKEVNPSSMIISDFTMEEMEEFLNKRNGR
jgi:hypothetical protein